MGIVIGLPSSFLWGVSLCPFSSLVRRGPEAEAGEGERDRVVNGLLELEAARSPLGGPHGGPGTEERGGARNSRRGEPEGRRRGRERWMGSCLHGALLAHARGAGKREIRGGARGVSGDQQRRGRALLGGYHTGEDSRGTWAGRGDSSGPREKAERVVGSWLGREGDRKGRGWGAGRQGRARCPWLLVDPGGRWVPLSLLLHWELLRASGSESQGSSRHFLSRILPDSHHEPLYDENSGGFTFSRPGRPVVFSG